MQSIQEKTAEVWMEAWIKHMPRSHPPSPTGTGHPF
jgi:hypothetical protein